MNFQEWRAWWTDRATTYFTDKAWSFSQPELIKRLGIGKESKVLEIGFGYGRELSQFCALSDNVHGVELSDWACRNTRKELKQRGIKPLPHLAKCDGQTLPYHANTFDVIYNCFVMQHLSREHAAATMKEALRVIKPGGKILFEFFGDIAFYDQGKDVFSGRDGDGGMFNNGYRDWEIKEMVNDVGGEVLWLEPQPIGENWSNYWVCFTKAGE